MTALFAHRETASTPPDIGRPTAELVLVSDGHAPHAARQAVRDVCRGRDRGCVAEAELVVTELVTNAVRHADGHDVAVHLWRGWRTVDCRVLDGGSGFTPRHRSSSDTEPGGRGLPVVDALVQSWGSSGEGAPSSVWFRSRMPSVTSFPVLPPSAD